MNKQLQVGQTITVKHQDDKLYDVKVLKIFEMNQWGNGFIQAQFPTGQIRTLLVLKEYEEK